MKRYPLLYFLLFAIPSALRFTSQNSPLGLFCLFILFLASCQPEPRNAVPADETHIYSGTFRAIQDPFIEVAGERYKNEFGEAPIQITAEVQNENLVFTIYGKDYGIYDVNLFVNHADCFEYNGSEIVDFRVDAFGNEEVRVLFNEDFWKKCYMDDDLEKVVGFVLKSERVVF